MKPVRRHALAILPTALTLLCAAVALGSEAAPTELERLVKAAYLFKFIGYVEWPADALAPGAPVTIGVVGDDRLASDLRQLIAGRSVEGHPVSVSMFSSEFQAPDTHILFIGRRERPRLDALIDRIPSRAPVLIVTESDGALGSGSIINFVIDRGRVRFAISLAAAERHRLTLRSGLLAVAQSVITGGP